MTDNVVARRYANAIFALGKSEGESALTKHGKALAELGEMIAAVPGLDTMLKSPVIGVDEKKAVLGTLLGKIKADQVIRNFCFLLADKERLASLKDIIDWYGKLLDKVRGIVRGTLTTAVKLTQAKQEELRAALGKKTGGTIELAFAVDKSILGGMVLSMGDRVLDASLRAQLGFLRETFKRGE